MTNNKMVVKGKVQNGVIEVIAVMEGRMVGYRKPLHSNKPAETFETRQVEAYEVPRDIRKAAMQGTTTPLTQMIETLSPKEEPIDSPFIKIVNENAKKQRALKEQRIREIEQHNKKMQRKQAVLDFFGLN